MEIMLLLKPFEQKFQPALKYLEGIILAKPVSPVTFPLLTSLLPCCTSSCALWPPTHYLAVEHLMTQLSFLVILQNQENHPVCSMHHRHPFRRRGTTRAAKRGLDCRRRKPKRTQMGAAFLTQGGTDKVGSRALERRGGMPADTEVQPGSRSRARSRTMRTTRTRMRSGLLEGTRSCHPRGTQALPCPKPCPVYPAAAPCLIGPSAASVPTSHTSRHSWHHRLQVWSSLVRDVHMLVLSCDLKVKSPHCP